VVVACVTHVAGVVDVVDVAGVADVTGVVAVAASFRGPTGSHPVSATTTARGTTFLPR
jgi:hypothetical protein